MRRAGDIRYGLRQGFTLVELMIVIAIIGIMTVLMIPEMKGSYEEAMLRSNARKLSSAFTAAYSRAITTHQLHRVRIDPNHARLLVEERSPNPETPYIPLKQFDRKESQLHTNVMIRFHQPPPVSIGLPGDASDMPMEMPKTEMPPGVFLFHPDGTSEGYDIEMRDRMGFGLLIHLNPVTSRVRFEHLPKVQP